MKPDSTALALCLVLSSLLGCSSGLEGVQKRLSSMQDEIVRLQNQNDRLVERVDAMEERETKAVQSNKSASKAAASLSRLPRKSFGSNAWEGASAPRPSKARPAAIIMARSPAFAVSDRT